MQMSGGHLLAAGLDGGNSIMNRISTLGPKNPEQYLLFLIFYFVFRFE